MDAQDWAVVGIGFSAFALGWSLCSLVFILLGN